MSLIGLGLKFGVKLNPDKPWVILDFDNFNQVHFGVGSRNEQPLLSRADRGNRC